MNDNQIKGMYLFYRNEVLRLGTILIKTKNRRTKSKLFNKIMKLKEKYDWTHDEIHERNIKI